MIRLSRAALVLSFLTALPALAAGSVGSPTDSGSVGSPTDAGGLTFASWVDGTVVPFVSNYVIPLLYAIAFLFFIYGVFHYFFTGGEENRTQGRDYVIWSLIGFVVIFGVWGIVSLLLALIPTV